MDVNEAIKCIQRARKQPFVDSVFLWTEEQIKGLQRKDLDYLREVDPDADDWVNHPSLRRQVQKKLVDMEEETELQQQRAAAVQQQFYTKTETDSRAKARTRGLSKAVVKAINEDRGRLAAIESRQASVADAGVVAKVIEENRQLKTQLDKLQQQLSANRKHCESLERKIGELMK